MIGRVVDHFTVINPFFLVVFWYVRMSWEVLLGFGRVMYREGAEFMVYFRRRWWTVAGWGVVEMEDVEYIDVEGGLEAEK